MAEDPRIVRSRALILAAAHDHFVRHGYIGTNVDLVAEAAGVAKRTVYNIYGDKETLFRAVVDEAIGIAEQFSRDLCDQIAADGLENVAAELIRAVLGPRVLPLRRMLIGEQARFPDLARAYYDRAPGLVMQTFAAYLDTRTDLAIDDTALAAEHLAFLILGAPLDRALFDASAIPTDLDARARAGVATFLRAYAAPGSR